MFFSVLRIVLFVTPYSSVLRLVLFVTSNSFSVCAVCNAIRFKVRPVWCAIPLSTAYKWARTTRRDRSVSKTVIHRGSHNENTGTSSRLNTKTEYCRHFVEVLPRPSHPAPTPCAVAASSARALWRQRLAVLTTHFRDKTNCVGAWGPDACRFYRLSGLAIFLSASLCATVHRHCTLPPPQRQGFWRVSKRRSGLNVVAAFCEGVNRKTASIKWDIYLQAIAPRSAAFSALVSVLWCLYTPNRRHCGCAAVRVGVSLASSLPLSL